MSVLCIPKDVGDHSLRNQQWLIIRNVYYYYTQYLYFIFKIAYTCLSLPSSLLAALVVAIFGAQRMQCNIRLQTIFLFFANRPIVTVWRFKKLLTIFQTGGCYIAD